MVWPYAMCSDKECERTKKKWSLLEKTCKTCFALLYGTLLCVPYRAFGAFLYGTLAQFFFFYQNCSSAAWGEVECEKIKSNSLVLHYIHQRKILIIRPQEEEKKHHRKPQNQINVMRAIGKFPYWITEQRKKNWGKNTQHSYRHGNEMSFLFENCLGINWIKLNPQDTFGRKIQRKHFFCRRIFCSVFILRLIKSKTNTK